MLAAGEQTAFVNAVLLLKDSTVAPSIIPQAQNIATSQTSTAASRYDDYVWLHLAAFSLIHTGPAFGPWHRELIRQFELDLRDVSGDDSIYVPYWDWPNGNDAADAGWPFVDSLMGGLGNAMAGYAVQTGPFAGSAAWPIRIHDPGDPHTELRRVATTNPTSGNIPDQATTRNALAAAPYDSPPYNATTFPTPNEALQSFRKSLEFFLHNGPHNWVGNPTGGPDLDMMAATSPNDPVFFLHHAAIDRIWQIWQERQGVLPSSTFAPSSGADTGHNLSDMMDVMDPSYFKWPALTTNAATLDLHASGVWYDSDLPQLSPLTFTVSFGTVAAGLTTYQPIQFTVEGCRAFSLRAVSISGSSNYFVPPGNAIKPIAAVEEPDARTEQLYVGFNAPDDGSNAGSASVLVEAYVIDTDGYLTGTAGAEHVFGTFTINLSAAVAPRVVSAIAFVSDRSGSMIGSVGAGLQKFDLLEEALEVATDLLASDDSASLVFFDSSTMTPVPMTTVGTGGAIASALADPAIAPSFGSTALGQGLIAGAAQLDSYVPPPDVPNPNLALVCLTDGNENVTPYVEDPPVTTAVAAYSNDLYAIGLGNAGSVSEDTLGAIANYMLVTGEISADERRFMVTKYFAQIMADIKDSEIVVDPEGVLTLGAVHEVHCDVSEADLWFEAVLVSPHARLIDIEIVTPGGEVLSAAALGPNASVRSNRLDTIFRVSLPALPTSPGTSHAGRWTIRLRLRDPKDRPIDLRVRAEVQTAAATALVTHGKRGLQLPYAVFVQARSNLRMKIGKQLPRVRPGEALPLALSLSQYDVPLASAQVTATITDPHGRSRDHRLTAAPDGTFHGQIPAPLAGVYRARIIARGQSMGGRRFTREAVRSFAVGPVVRPSRTPVVAPGESTKWCDLLACMLGDRAILRRLKEWGVDIERLRRCLAKACSDRPQEPGTPSDGKPDAPCPPTAVRPAAAPLPAAIKKELAALVDALDPKLRERLDEAAEARSLAPPTVDPALFVAPMFMPVLAWKDDGTIEVVGGHGAHGHHGHDHGGHEPDKGTKKK